MKRYKINKVTGTTQKWRFAGWINNYEEEIQEFEKWEGRDGVKGIKITDTETNKVIYERKV